jgi:hypothetical protein
MSEEDLKNTLAHNKEEFEKIIQNNKTEFDEAIKNLTEQSKQFADEKNALMIKVERLEAENNRLLLAEQIAAVKQTQNFQNSNLNNSNRKKKYKGPMTLRLMEWSVENMAKVAGKILQGTYETGNFLLSNNFEKKTLENKKIAEKITIQQKIASLPIVAGYYENKKLKQMEQANIIMNKNRLEIEKQKAKEDIIKATKIKAAEKIKNAPLPDKLLGVLSSNSSWNKRLEIATNLKNDSLDNTKAFSILSKDSQAYIRSAVANNANTPSKILAEMTKDLDSIVSQAATTNLSLAIARDSNYGLASQLFASKNPIDRLTAVESKQLTINQLLIVNEKETDSRVKNAIKKELSSRSPQEVEMYKKKLEVSGHIGQHLRKSETNSNKAKEDDSSVFSKEFNKKREGNFVNLESIKKDSDIFKARKNIANKNSQEYIKAQRGFNDAQIVLRNGFDKNSMEYFEKSVVANGKMNAEDAKYLVNNATANAHLLEQAGILKADGLGNFSFTDDKAKEILSKNLGAEYQVIKNINKNAYKESEKEVDSLKESKDFIKKDNSEDFLRISDDELKALVHESINPTKSEKESTAQKSKQVKPEQTTVVEESVAEIIAQIKSESRGIAQKLEQVKSEKESTAQKSKQVKPEQTTVVEESVAEIIAQIKSESRGIAQKLEQVKSEKESTAQEIEQVKPEQTTVAKESIEEKLEQVKSEKESTAQEIEQVKPELIKNVFSQKTEPTKSENEIKKINLDNLSYQDYNEKDQLKVEPFKNEKAIEKNKINDPSLSDKTIQALDYTFDKVGKSVKSVVEQLKKNKDKAVAQSKNNDLEQKAVLQSKKQGFSK